MQIYKCRFMKINLRTWKIHESNIVESFLFLLSLTSFIPTDLAFEMCIVLSTTNKSLKFFLEIFINLFINVYIILMYIHQYTHDLFIRIDFVTLDYLYVIQVDLQLTCFYFWINSLKFTLMRARVAHRHFLTIALNHE